MDEREKLAIQAAASGYDPPGIIELERFFSFIIPCVIFPAVVVIIAVFVNLKQTVYIGIGCFAVVSLVWVKQV